MTPHPGGVSGMEAQRDAILVTGSSGLIGAAVVRRLARHYRILGLDRAGPPYPPPPAECIDVDLASDRSVAQAIAEARELTGGRLAAVVHLAAYYDFSGEDSPLYDQVTVEGTRRLLRALQGLEVGQFLFTSTMLVHAPTQPGRPITEDAPLQPTWPYPESKVKTEQVIAAERGRIPAVLLRVAGVYTDRCESIPLAHQIQRIYERWLVSHFFPGDPTHGNAFVHLDDVVDAIGLSIASRARLPDFHPLLIGEPETLSYQRLQDEFGQLLHGRPWATYRIPKPLAKAGAWLEGAVLPGRKPFIRPWMIDRADEHYELDIARARQTLGWQPQRRLADTLPVMTQRLEADPVEWYAINNLHPSAHVAERSTQPSRKDWDVPRRHPHSRLVRFRGS